MASYSINPDAVEQAERLIDSRQYVLDSDWGQVQPRASDQNAYLERHSWQEYARWYLGLTDGAADETKARYAFVYGDFGRIHRMGPDVGLQPVARDVECGVVAEARKFRLAGVLQQLCLQLHGWGGAAARDVAGARPHRYDSQLIPGYPRDPDVLWTAAVP